MVIMQAIQNLINFSEMQKSMQTSQHANDTSTTGTQNTEQSTVIQFSNPKNAVYVWDKMQEIFGNAWVNQFKAIPNQSWVDALSQLTEKDINRGLNNVIRDSLDYPPNLPKFLNLCKPEIVEDVYKQEKETRLYLENIKSKQKTDSVKKEHLRIMHTLVGIREKDNENI